MEAAEATPRIGQAPAPAPYKWLVALAVMLGPALEVLDTSIINVALPHLQGTFSASVDEIAWVLTSYLVANGIMIPMTGWISSRFGRKRYFLTSVFAFIGASALCGAAQTLSQMVVFRLIQGAAGAAMIPSSQAIMMETFPPEEQQMAMALWGMARGSGREGSDPGRRGLNRARLVSARQHSGTDEGQGHLPRTHSVHGRIGCQRMNATATGG
jgi:hypothetical protein